MDAHELLARFDRHKKLIQNRVHYPANDQYIGKKASPMDERMGSDDAKAANVRRRMSCEVEELTLNQSNTVSIQQLYSSSIVTGHSQTKSKRTMIFGYL
jgi:hypothetical protein